MGILEKISSPEDVKKVPEQKIDLLCKEIREKLIKTVSKTGGHLASNLGVVELTVAIHRTFRSPADRIVWDVGHQSYVHKLLTGRQSEFDTLRQKNGISGFPKPAESVHDTFISGHSSTSISVAYGIAKAKKLKGEPGKVIAVIGDGALTGGMAFEALNNAGRDKIDNLIVIINDNKMSISKNVGSLTKHLSAMRNDPKYYRTKDRIGGFLDNLPVVGKPTKSLLSAVKSTAKDAIYRSNYFEDLGFQYLGPVNGHSVKELTDVLSRAKSIKEPVVIYVYTVKGKGYVYAEQNPGAYHGISRFDIETGNPDVQSEHSFSRAMGTELVRIGSEDPAVCAVTAAMKYGTELQHFAKNFPKRFFDVGIAEEHAVTFCAGLAHEGMRPVFAVYSSFLQRAYDQLIHDVAISNEHVVFAVDRAGIVGEDGETHQGLFDISMLCSVPNMTIFSPANYQEVRACLNTALYEYKGPVAVRYPRGQELGVLPNTQTGHFVRNEQLYFVDGADDTRDILLITYGRLSSFGYQAVERLRKNGVKINLLQLVKVFPIEDEIIALINTFKKVFFVEESYKIGSIGQMIGDRIAEGTGKTQYYHKAFEGFIPQATTNEIFREYGFDVDGIVAYITERI